MAQLLLPRSLVFLFARGALLALALSAPIRCHAHEPDEVAITDLTAQLRDTRSPANALLVRAELHRAAEQWDSAQRDLADARAIDPHAPLLELCTAVLALERGRPAEALPAFERYLRVVPSDGNAHAWFARALLAVGMPREAAAQYDAALSLTPRRVTELLLARALLVDSLEGRAAALEYVERGLVRAGASAPLELRALDLEMRLERPEAALARLARLEAAGWDRATMGWHRGVVLQASGRSLDACVAWSDALATLDQRAARSQSSLEHEALRQRLRNAVDQELAASTGLNQQEHP